MTDLAPQSLSFPYCQVTVGVVALLSSWGPLSFIGPICENKYLATTLPSFGAPCCLVLYEHTQGNSALGAMGDISSQARDRPAIWSLTHSGHSEIGLHLGSISSLPEKIRGACLGVSVSRNVFVS